MQPEPEPEHRSGPRPVRVEADEPTPIRHLVAAAVQAGARLHAAEAEYALGMAAVARAARRGGATDNSAARECASALGITRQTLQPYALLAMRWTPQELRVLLERQDCNGRRISLSHLLILSRLSHAERLRRTEEVFVEGLGVHDLRARIRASRGQTTNRMR
jgi:hypothetical protein